jgi:hypothetical protein
MNNLTLITELTKTSKDIVPEKLLVSKLLWIVHNYRDEDIVIKKIRQITNPLTNDFINEKCAENLYFNYIIKGEIILDPLFDKDNFTQETSKSITPEDNFILSVFQIFENHDDNLDFVIEEICKLKHPVTNDFINKECITKVFLSFITKEEITLADFN